MSWLTFQQLISFITQTFLVKHSQHFQLDGFYSSIFLFIQTQMSYLIWLLVWKVYCELTLGCFNKIQLKITIHSFINFSVAKKCQMLICLFKWIVTCTEILKAVKAVYRIKWTTHIFPQGLSKNKNIEFWH